MLMLKTNSSARRRMVIATIVVIYVDTLCVSIHKINNHSKNMNLAEFDSTTSGIYDNNTNNANPKKQYAIFFNTFAKGDEANHARAHGIIQSQLQEINSQPLLNGAPVFYVRLGDLDWEWPVSLCTNKNNVTSSSFDMIPHHQQQQQQQQQHRQCTQIAAQPEGDEIISLQSMHQYCVKNQHARVIYMHSKGTYTASPQNDQLRTILMKAITSKECLDFPKDNNGCNTCSTRLNYAISPMYVGNMFVADCNYISKLIPPIEFEPRKRRMIDQMRNNTIQTSSIFYETRLNDRMHYKFRKQKLAFIDRKSLTGIGRYAAEHWLGSHPDLKPCEVFGPENDNPDVPYGKEIKMDRYKPPTLEKIQETISAQNISLSAYHPWFGIDGRLYSYEYLYSTIPQNGSWFYSIWGQPASVMAKYSRCIGKYSKESCTTFMNSTK